LNEKQEWVTPELKILTSVDTTETVLRGSAGGWGTENSGPPDINGPTGG